MTTFTITAVIFIIILDLFLSVYLYKKTKVLEKEYIKLVADLDTILQEREILYRELFLRYNKDKRMSEYIKRFTNGRNRSDENE
jgi:hypothetical protein